MVRLVEVTAYECGICGEVYIADYEAEDCEKYHRKRKRKVVSQ